MAALPQISNKKEAEHSTRAWLALKILQSRADMALPRLKGSPPKQHTPSVIYSTRVSVTVLAKIHYLCGWGHTGFVTQDWIGVQSPKAEE